MCEGCGNPEHLLRIKSPERRQFLVSGATLAAASLAIGAPDVAEAQETTSPASLGASRVRAYGAASATAPIRPIEITRRAVGPHDVLLDILYCGVCHSDIHTIRGEWGPTPYPCVTGHEIVGRVIGIGSAVTKFRIGDIGGVGCMVDSCRVCANCVADLEQYCLNGATFTYASPDPATGGHTLGGYSERIVVTEHFVIRIPPGADLAATAPLLCAGITTFSPMQHWKLEGGQNIGVIGLGGLDHVAVKLAAARKANVTVFTTSSGKIADAKRLGADAAVLSTDSQAMKAIGAKFDLMISTVPEAYPIQPFLDLLKLDGALINVGAMAPPLHDIDGLQLARSRRSLAGSIIGGIAETQEVINYCADRNIKADITLIQPDQINQAFERVVNKDVRYRFVIDMKKSRAG
jgi:alcohol dehydrogenase (NADP+)